MEAVLLAGAGPSPLTLIATATDDVPASPLKVFWTVRDPATGQSTVQGQGATSGVPFTRTDFKPQRAGTYTVFATIYDGFKLFDECHWNITVVPNNPPSLVVVVDDVVIDFGRLDAAPAIPGPGQPDRRVIGVGPGAGGNANLCAYLPPDPPTTVLKTLPIDSPNAGEHATPLLQYPPGMTCIFAVISDPDGDLLSSGGFKLPIPIFGEGNLYLAVPIPPLSPAPMLPGSPFEGQTVGQLVPSGLPVGAAIDNDLKMEAYNATLVALANAGGLPSRFTAAGTLVAGGGFAPGVVALPVVFEAPDDPDPSLSTHDCRHPTVQNTPPCQISRGGTINVEARATDGFSTERTAFGTVIYPDPAIVFPGGFGSLTITPTPPDPGPGVGVTVRACGLPPRAGVTINFSIVGTDGFTKAQSPVTAADGCASFFIPGGTEGVVDVVTVVVPVQAGIPVAIAPAPISYTF